MTTKKKRKNLLLRRADVRRTHNSLLLLPLSPRRIIKLGIDSDRVAQQRVTRDDFAKMAAAPLPLLLFFFFLALEIF